MNDEVAVPRKVLQGIVEWAEFYRDDIPSWPHTKNLDSIQWVARLLELPSAKGPMMTRELADKIVTKIGDGRYELCTREERAEAHQGMVEWVMKECNE